MINYKRLAAILIAAIVFTLAGIPTQIQNTAKASTTTPGTCVWTGTWDTNWGKMELVQTGSIRSGADITGTASRTPTVGYSNIVAVALGGMLTGTWSKPPSYGPPADAGDIELTISRDCNSFTGKWRYGYGTGKWDGDWTGRRTGSGSSSPPTEQLSKEIVCASAKPSYTAGGEFKPAWFTIGGSMAQKVRITQSAENFSIKKEYGGVIFQMTKGKSWGSLTLDPGTYVLSCNGGGPMGTMSASVCVEFPSSNQVSPPPSSGGQTVKPDPDDKKKPSTGGAQVNNNLPQGPSERIIVRPKCDLTATSLRVKTGKKEPFTARGADANGNINMRSLLVDEWKVTGDEGIGFINRDGVFQAGKAGSGKIIATATNQEGYDIIGVFPITVTSVPLITFKGLLKLYDENGRPYYPGNVEITLRAKSYRNRGDWNHGSFFDNRSYVKEFKFVSKTDAKGWFRFIVPIEVDGFFLASWYWMAEYPPTCPRGFEWKPKPTPDGQPDSSEAIYNDPAEPGRSEILVSPKGFPCFEMSLEEVSISYWIFGKITHKGKPVDGAQVTLLDKFNNPQAKGTSSSDGGYQLCVDNLSKGRYQLTAKHEPKKPSETNAFVQPEPWQITTVHNRLCQKNNISVELPLKTESKTIDIEMITFAQKIGYRERGVKGVPTESQSVPDERPERNDSRDWNDRPWVIDNNNNGGRGSGDDDNVQHNTDTNWGKPSSMEPYQKYNFE